MSGAARDPEGKQAPRVHQRLYPGKELHRVKPVHLGIYRLPRAKKNYIVAHPAALPMKRLGSMCHDAHARIAPDFRMARGAKPPP